MATARTRKPVPGGFGLLDLFWAALAGAIGALYLLGFASTLWDLANGRARWAAVAMLPLGLFAGWWLALGAWRRTVWGAREPHAEGGANEGGANEG